MKLFVTLPIVLLFTGFAYADDGCSGLPLGFCKGKKGRPNGVRCSSQNNAPGGNFKGCSLIEQDPKTKDNKWCISAEGYFSLLGTPWEVESKIL
ncbi:hypothetical protein HYALB_00008037 [Hymenoscyphus albidus]|uniref:Uncharacterized protein n=1 Tax=Hymenoscyphus albidus TaxID=595503 RepID=A0A9N9LLN9_9HELO|nr:hypothetical protein HYALB_00008037 [Hymenoscyphus albidus]